MHKVTVTTAQTNYDVIICSDLLTPSNLEKHLAPFQQLFLIIDEHLVDVSNRFTNERIVGQYILPSGEINKSFQHYYQIQTQVIESGLRRNGAIVAIGGGVVGDLAGFVAATYQRGCSLVQVPSTLLSAVDSSVGGKTAINHPLGKNLIGAFYQPSLVLIDTQLWQSLPSKQLINGFAEVLKYAILSSPQLFEFLEQLEDVRTLSKQQSDDLVAECVAIKARYVEEDTQDLGIRNLLNLGHTFGHAIEQIHDYKGILHGEAVAIGMVLAAKYAASKSYCDKGLPEKIARVCNKLGLPSALPPNCVSKQMVSNMLKDKKNMQQGVNLILPKEVGDCFSKENVPVAQLERFFDELG